MPQDIIDGLNKNMVPPISEFDKDLRVCWAIPRTIKRKKTRTGKDYFEVEVTDSNSVMTKLRCWGVDPSKGDNIIINAPYLIKPEHSPEWGFSTRGKISTYWQLLG